MEDRSQLKRTLRPSNVWALALGTIIGFGCFILPGDWISQAGPMGVALGFFFGGLMMLYIGRIQLLMVILMLGSANLSGISTV